MRFLLLLIAFFPLITSSQCFKVGHVFNFEVGIFQKQRELNIDEDGKFSDRSSISCNEDYSKYYIIPGLIDNHTHIFIADKSFGQNFSEELQQEYNLNNELRINRAKKNLRSFLDVGILSVRDLGNSGEFLDKKLFDEVKNDKKNIYPNLFFSGPGITIFPGQFSPRTNLDVIKKEYILINGIEDFKREILRYKTMGVKLLKVYADNDPSEGGMDKKLLCQIVEMAHENKIFIAAHATNQQSIQNAVSCNVNSVEHGYFLSGEILREMKKKGIFLVPTDISSNLYGWLLKISKRNNVEIKQRSIKLYRTLMNSRIKLAKKAQIPLAFGSDSYIDFSKMGKSMGEVAIETLYSYRESGLSNKDILKMAMISDLVGEKLGRIDKGYIADFIVLRKNPLEDIRNLSSIVAVYKRGKKVR